MILVNGAECGQVSAIDRGLAYGDGVFRTVAIESGYAVAWAHHYRKLEHDCRALAIDCPDEASLRREIEVLASRAPDCAAKIIVTRGEGRRGYAPPEPSVPTRIVMSFPLPQHPPEFARSGVKVRWCTLRLGPQPALAGVKHLNRLENVLARLEWRDPGIAEGLLCDDDGNVIGGTMTNLFLVENGCLATPDLGWCGVAGVTRERVLEAAASHGIACSIESLPADRVRAADEVFLVNSLIGVWQVRTLDEVEWPAGKLCARIRRWIDEKKY